MPVAGTHSKSKLSIARVGCSADFFVRAKFSQRSCVEVKDIPVLRGTRVDATDHWVDELVGRAYYE